MTDARNWTSLYQQNPTPEEGTYFKREDFKWYDDNTRQVSALPRGDFAVSEGRGDFTEIGVFGIDKNDDIYIAPDNGWWSGQKDFRRLDRPFIRLCQVLQPANVHLREGRYSKFHRTFPG